MTRSPARGQALVQYPRVSTGSNTVKISLMNSMMGESASSASLQNGDEGLMHRLVVLTFRGTSRDEEMAWQGSHQVQRRGVPSFAPWEE